MNKPQAIIALEKEIGEELSEIPIAEMKWENRNTYSFNEKGEVLALDLSNNRMTEIPDLRDFHALEYLCLYSNKISKIENLEHLANLKNLELTGNKISKIENLKHLTQLQKLNLSFNLINKIENVGYLTQLQNLNLSVNEISKIENVGHLTQLQELNLSVNEISKIENIEHLSNLQKLWLNSNEISKIENLEHLTQLNSLMLSSNQISSESDVEILIENLVQLEYLSLNNNPIPLDNIYLLEYYDCLPKLRSYFEEKRKSGEVELCEMKVILLGNGGAGKTSFRRRWAEKMPDLPPLDSTDKFEIVVADFPLVKDSRDTQTSETDNQATAKDCLTARIWDFSGQQIDHQIHHFFLTADAYYILLHDNRKEGTNFGYWFYLIRLMCEKTQQRECVQQPISIILNNNTIDNPNAKAEFNEKSYFEHFPELHINAYTTDLKKSSYDDLYENLFFPIQERALTLLGGKKSYPKSWIQVRDALAETKDNYLSKREYNKICERFGITKSEGQAVLLAYLNRVGALIHFPAHKLNQTLFLNPEWVANALYTALRSEEISKGNGFFSKTTLFEIWQKGGLSPDDCEHLLPLMGDEGFLICYPVDNQGDKYGYPQKLRTENKVYPLSEKSNFEEDKEVLFANLAEEKKDLPIALRIQLDLNAYASLSELLKQVFKDAFSRLAVSFHKQFKINEFGQQLVWNTGMILEKRHEKAFIELRNTNQLWIYTNSAFYLTTLIEKWSEIREAYFKQILPETIISREIPCTCEVVNPCFMDFEEVKEAHHYKDMLTCKKSRKERQPQQDAARFLHRWKLLPVEREMLFKMDLHIRKLDSLSQKIESQYDKILDTLADNQIDLGEHYGYVREAFSILAEQLAKDEEKTRAKVELEEKLASITDEIQQFDFLDNYVKNSDLLDSEKQAYFYLKNIKNNALSWIGKELIIGAIADKGKDYVKPFLQLFENL